MNECDESGRCTASKTASGVTNCIYCGKELVEVGGSWYTWDADLVSLNPIPQNRL
jgi:hypothetical protein